MAEIWQPTFRLPESVKIAALLTPPTPPETITADKWHPLIQQPYAYRTEIVNY